MWRTASQNGSVAQAVEHRSETTSVVSANLTGTTIYISHIYQYSTYFWLPQDKSKYSVNSIGRVLLLQGRGYRFKSYTEYHFFLLIVGESEFGYYWVRDNNTTLRVGSSVGRAIGC